MIAMTTPPIGPVMSGGWRPRRRKGDLRGALDGLVRGPRKWRKASPEGSGGWLRIGGRGRILLQGRGRGMRRRYLHRARESAKGGNGAASDVQKGGGWKGGQSTSEWERTKETSKTKARNPDGTACFRGGWGMTHGGRQAPGPWSGIPTARLPHPTLPGPDSFQCTPHPTPTQLTTPHYYLTPHHHTPTPTHLTSPLYSSQYLPPPRGKMQQPEEGRIRAERGCGGRGTFRFLRNGRISIRGSFVVTSIALPLGETPKKGQRLRRLRRTTLRTLTPSVVKKRV